MRYLFSFIILSVLVNYLHAEGTHELAPNGEIYIHDTLTTDIAALHIGSDEFNNFALIGNQNKYSRLYINIQDPAKEVIYLGFSKGHFNITSKTPPEVNFTFVIKDPNGNIVYGPHRITPSSANIHNWATAYNGPQPLTSEPGYIPIVIGNLQSRGWSGEGNYYIQFDYDRDVPGPSPGLDWDGFLIDFWDITVVNTFGTFPVVKKGRVWSYNWALFAINDFGFPERPFNGKFYVCAVDSSNESTAFISSIDFNQSGFRPAAFNIAFNSFGTRNTGSVEYNRRSVSNANLASPLYPIFLNDPVDIFKTPAEGSIEFVKMERAKEGTMCFQIKASKTGIVEILLDFHGGDGKYTESTEDVLLSSYISTDQVGLTVCIPWNGIDGTGTPIINSSFPIKIIYNRGIFHFPIYDAEYLSEGFQLTRVRPEGPTPLLFYDDSEISRNPGTEQPVKNLSGCLVPCHTWNTYTNPDVPGFGNLNTINSWWYSKRISLRAQVTIDLNYYLPNAFTPNGDGINDRAKVFIGKDILGIKKMEIFDRWGNRVYEEKHSKSVKKMVGWNGKYKGLPLNPAVFVYKVTVEVHPGIYITEYGTLTLIR